MKLIIISFAILAPSSFFPNKYEPKQIVCDMLITKTNKTLNATIFLIVIKYKIQFNYN